MKYSYFPGCCKHATGKPYYISTQALCEKLGIELKELPDWNCCGSTSYFSVRELESFGISARNLAIAQEQGDMDLVAICSACYTVLAKTNRYLADDPVLQEEINEALAAAGRHYDGNVKRAPSARRDGQRPRLRRHRREGRRADLDGLKVACYYGCQLTRPMGSFDDPEFPTTMDNLVEALGGDARRLPREDQVLRRHADAAPKRRRLCGSATSCCKCARERRRRGHRHRLPSVPDERRGLPADGQQGLRHRLRDPGHVLHPARRHRAGRRHEGPGARQADRRGRCRSSPPCRRECAGRRRRWLKTRSASTSVTAALTSPARSTWPTSSSGPRRSPGWSWRGSTSTCAPTRGRT